MGKCILLARVSTEKQDLVQQTNELLKAAHDCNYSDNDIIIIEDKESGIKLSFEEREGINKLIDTINKEPVERVICYEISRIARRADVFYRVRDILIEKKIQLQVLTPSFCLLNDDFTINENSNLLIGIFLSMAESEMRIKKARFQRGKQKRADMGLYNGGPVLLGYQLSKEGKYMIDPEGADTVKKIFKLYTEYKWTPKQIATELISTGELWHRNVVSGSRYVFYLTRNPIYGTGSNEGAHFYKNHPGKEQKYIIKAPKIISEDTWKKAQEISNQRDSDNGSKNRHRDLIYFAHGIIFSDEGFELGPNHKNSTYQIRQYDKITNGAKHVQININMIDSLLFHIVKRIISCNNETDQKNILKSLRQKQTDCFNKISKAHHDNEQLDKEIERIEERIISGRLDEDKGNEMQEERYDKKIDLEVKISEWEDETIKLDEQIRDLLNNDKVYDLDSMSDQEKKDIIQKYIKSVIVTKTGSYTYELNVDGITYQMNTNSSCRWIKNALNEDIDYVYLNRYNRDYKKGQ